ncbi:MAG: Coenzyme F420 hydrogenase/dehydrogenase, beta subunit C-terminal domain [Planctomycetota bacterium]
MTIALPQIESVVDRGLCCGCGACAGLAPDSYRMVDHEEDGLRPQRRPGSPAAPEDVRRACPGIALQHETPPDEHMTREWGPVRAVFEGHAIDPDTRHIGSSGGVITALADHGLRSGSAAGVLHVRARTDAPWLNETTLSTTSSELRRGAGSRYAPASPIEGLPLLEDVDGPCVVVGKPCDIAALHQACRSRPALRDRIAVTIALFCAGTPSTRGTIEMLRAMGIDDHTIITSLRYRGHGWPGEATASLPASTGPTTRALSYEKAWGEILTRHKQWRCRICPDHTGELADIAVGDPWDRPPTGEEPGRSLVVARTARGAAWIDAARTSGIVALDAVDADRIETAQPALRVARGQVWGRLLALRVLRQPTPTFRGFPMFRAWWSALTWRQKAQSLIGTIRRVRRGRHRPELNPDHDIVGRIEPSSHRVAA